MRRLLTIGLACAACTALDVPAARAAGTFAAAVALERMHDDNILQLTPSEIDRLVAGPNHGRFRVTSADDDINVLRADLGWRATWLPRRESRLTLSADAYGYQRNRVKNWQQYGLTYVQEMTASRRRLAVLEASVQYTPSFYLREVTDVDASVAAGRRLRRSLDYSQMVFGLRYRQELFGDRLELALGATRVHRDYNANFNERDNDDDLWRVRVEGRPFPHWRFTLGAQYAAGRLGARGDLPGNGVRDSDISYRHHGLGFSLGVPWGRGATRGWLEAEWQPQERRYTTGDKYDLQRHGRVNRRQALSVRLVQRLWGPLDAVASYQRLSSSATFPDNVEFDEDVTDFRQSRLALMVRARWDVGIGNAPRHAHRARD